MVGGAIDVETTDGPARAAAALSARDGALAVGAPKARESGGSERYGEAGASAGPSSRMVATCSSSCAIISSVCVRWGQSRALCR
jgi:hypothetical protein